MLYGQYISRFLLFFPLGQLYFHTPFRAPEFLINVMMLQYSLNYLIACGLCFLCAGWMIVKVLSEKAPAADDDRSEGLGGLPNGYTLPIFDPPGGCHLDDILVDRMPLHDRIITSGPEVSGHRTRKEISTARRHPRHAEPLLTPAGWHEKN